MIDGWLIIVIVILSALWAWLWFHSDAWPRFGCDVCQARFPEYDMLVAHEEEQHRPPAPISSRDAA